MKSSIVGSVALALLPGIVFGQQVIEVIDGIDFSLFESGGITIQSGTPVPTGAAAEGEAEAESERTKRLKQLKFDRRPSVILKAWSEPPKPEEEDVESKAVEGEGAAVERAAGGEPSEGASSERAATGAPTVGVGGGVVGGGASSDGAASSRTGDSAASDTSGSDTGAAGDSSTSTSSDAAGEPAATTAPASDSAGEQSTADAAGSDSADGAGSTSTEGASTTEGSTSTESADAATGSDSASESNSGAASDSSGNADPAVGSSAASAEASTQREGGETTEGEAPAQTDEERAAAEAAAEAARAAAEAEAKAKEEAERKAAEEKALTAELELFQRRVTLGQWSAIKEYLAGLDEAEAKAGYKQLLASLHQGAPRAQGQFAQYAEVNFYDPSDIYGLIDIAPFELEQEDLDKLGKLVTECVKGGSLIEHVIDRVRGGIDREALTCQPAQFARILLTANYPVEAGEFLPELEVAQQEDDRVVLNLLSRHYLAKHGEESKSSWLEKSWQALQSVLADGEVEDEVKEEALTRAVEVAPRVSEELGQAWLAESFTSRPGRGMEILRVIGASASEGLFKQARASEARFKGLELQTTAANALLEASPERADEWSETLNLLASNWLREASYSYTNDTSTQRGPSMQRDYYGNYFYFNSRNQMNRNMPEAIASADLVDIRPSDAWLDRVDVGLQPKFTMLIAQLLLKLNEEAEAFPYIERLAHANPERGKDLVEEFLRVWADNHNPNSERQRTSSYMFIYGFEQRANSIPLTRSKQERNLVELSEWVTRLRALPIEGIDEELIARAFTNAHSQAEVYRLETIERVFGDLGALEPKTLSELVQKMRQNLVGVWREPSTQKDAKTNRRQKDIQSEVLRGYEVALAVIEKALVDHPRDWSLVLARASLLHDENNFRAEVSKSSEFAGRRQEAFGEFARAAALYADGIDELDQEEESTKVYETWFYASLGACDLNAIDDQKVPVETQYAKIREALMALPAERAERHVGNFANTLFTRMSNVNPSVKYGYVRAGLDIVGDHERARDAREVFEYYADLVTEIRLEARIDGTDQVAQGQPFGLFVDLLHTREIEREAGGFSKYLVNQNNQRFSYNYGRPTENYRDKFEEIAHAALDEHFVVRSITFNHPETNSQATDQYGWRVTPYAYLLLEARGPEIDRVPPLRLDLDFLDTTGYAILPVESSPVVIDATASEPTARPFADLELTQTLDERQADEGKLILEVQATANGLVPDLDVIADLAPEGFDVVSTQDQGVSVDQFDEEGDGRTVKSGRTWMITMRAQEDLEQLPASFSFAEPKVEGTEAYYQRFVDADLERVERTIALNESYGERNRRDLLALVLGIPLLLAIFWFVLRAMRPREAGPAAVARYRVPENLSAFTVIGLLRDIGRSPSLADGARADLERDLEHLESFYFGEVGHTPPDLAQVAQAWIARVR